jgi:hypothetical protein
MTSDSRRWAIDVADWIERELTDARSGTKEMSMRPFVQNAELIVEALREYAAAARIGG